MQQPRSPREGAQPSSPRHLVLPGAADAPQPLVPFPEPSLVDVLLCDHRHTLTLFNHATKAAAQGNIHAMELLAGALALDIRLHAQAVTDVLCPLLERRFGAEGAELAARAAQQLTAVERDVLEMLTLRRERDWPALAQRMDMTHKDYATHVHDVEVDVLPRLAATLRPDELASSGLLFSQQKQTASLAPKTGSAFDAAAVAGPHAASVLGGPLLAGAYQPHAHHSGAAVGGATAGLPAAAGGVAGEVPIEVFSMEGMAGGALGGTPGSGPMPFLQQLGSQVDGSGDQLELPVAVPDKVVTPSQQVLMGEEQ